MRMTAREGIHATFLPVGRDGEPGRTEHVPGFGEADRAKVESILSVLDGYAGYPHRTGTMADVFLDLLRRDETPLDFYAGWDTE